MTDNGGGDAAAHPLVGLLFWFLGKDLHDGARDSISELSMSPDGTPDNRFASADGRVLSWKDDNPDEKLVTWHEFADVKAPDMPLADENGNKDSTRPSGSNLKPGGTTLARSRVVTDVERTTSEDDLNRRSPNSDQWGLFVSLTPPIEYYTEGSSTNDNAAAAPTEQQSEKTHKKANATDRKEGEHRKSH